MIRSPLLWILTACLTIVLTVYWAFTLSVPIGTTTGEAARIVTDYRRTVATIDTTRLKATIQRLSTLPERLTGLAGARATANYLRETFTEMGFAPSDSAGFWRRDGTLRQITERFPTLIPVDKGSRLTLADAADSLFVITLYPLWPNLVRTSSVAPEGIEGPLVYAGDGTPGALNGQTVAGSLALVQFDCGPNWLTVASLGARAIVFIESENVTRGEAELKFLSVPADIPRFWVTASDGARLRSMVRTSEPAVAPRATLTATVDWEWRDGENILAYLPWTDPHVADEPVVLEAYYDAMSIVPTLSPGAEQACGVAALLEVARFLKDHPLKRPVLFLATAGHGQALAGTKAFVQRHFIDANPAVNGALFLSLDLSSGSDRLGLLYKGYFYDETARILQPWVSQLARRSAALANEIGQALGVDPDRLLVDGVNPTKGRTWQTYIPGNLALNSEPVMLAGRPGLSFVTVEDARLRIDTPHDFAERVNLENLTRQTQMLVLLLPNLLNTSAPFLTKRLTNLWTELSGRVVEFDVSVSVLPDKPVPDALVVTPQRFSPRTLMGVRTIPVTKSDADGRFTVSGLPSSRAVGRERSTIELGAYAVDPSNGAVRYAPDRGQQGAGNFPIKIPMIQARREASIVVFRCVALTLLDLVDQRTFNPFIQTVVYDAGTNGTPFLFGYTEPQSGYMNSPLPAMVFFGQPGARFRITMSSGLAGKQLLLLNATADDPDGDGVPFPGNGTEPTPSLYVPYQAAHDMWTLDDYRVRQFARYGIVNHQVDRLHDSAGALLAEARQALTERRYDTYVASSKAAWSVESRAYPDILGTVEDAILGVLFYLALLVPFSYFVERLLFAARRIETRILGVTGVFVAVFLALQAIHPAFSITLTPLIVLLAFLIITMAAAVIVIVTMKFEARMSGVKREQEGRHEDDVSRSGAIGASVTLGIANLRHRPFRTVLTCVTLILLTFSVLSFTSVTSYLRTNTTEYPKAHATYEGLLLRTRNWEPLAEEAFATLSNEFGARGPVAPRAWYYSSRMGDLSFIDLHNPTTDSTFVATALVGVSEQETRLRPELREAIVAGRWFEEGEEEGVVLPVRVAERLGITASSFAGATLTVAGATVPVIGLIDGSRMDRLADLDAEPLTPVDFVQMSERRKNGPPDPEEFEVYVHLRSDNVVFLPYDFVLRVGGRLMSVGMRMKDAAAVMNTLDTLMPRTALTLFAGVGERVVMYSTIGATSVGGLGDLFIPILISALIVMNTMLGSVYERTREIGVFNAVGLAPAHVGALFIAEAVVYSVIGVIIGYLLGQSVAHLIIVSGWLPGFQLNVSSLAAVGASLLVMVVVIASTLYPARMASRLAMPAAEMGWRLPVPDKDRLTVVLPFTVTGVQAAGVNLFLKEYLDAHTEVAVGDFACEGVTLERGVDGAPDGLSLGFVVWLTPYDLGVSQRAALHTTPTEDAAIFDLTLVIDRLSGDTVSWLRLNRVFLNIIRKQFLIWRTLGKAGQQAYMARSN